jgi:hypothetical protein
VNWLVGSELHLLAPYEFDILTKIAWRASFIEVYFGVLSLVHLTSWLFFKKNVELLKKNKLVIFFF